MPQAAMPRATFYFDIGSPYAYLAAERLETVFSAPVRLQPVSLGGLFKLTGRSSWALGGAQSREEGIAEVERRAISYGLPRVCWPDPWPGNYLMAMRAATFAQLSGRGRELAREAFRAMFQQGHDLSVPEHVLKAAASAGLDPSEVERATRDPEVKLALREATDAAYALGVIGVPTVAVDNRLFWGDDRLEGAVAYLQSS